MKRNHLIIVLALLVMPLMFVGNAGAVYNGDATIQNSTGGWDLAPRYCVKYPDGTDGTTAWTGTGTIPQAHKYITTNTTYAACKVVTAPQSTVIGALSKTDCTTYGYDWYGSSCRSYSWTADDPANLSGVGHFSNHDGCARCHNNIDGRITNTARNTQAQTYIFGGHKNMLRKVNPPLPWALPDAGIISGDSSGNIINWNMGTIGGPTIGTCSVAGNTSQTACTTAGGTWTNAAAQMFWLYGGNGLSGTIPSIISDNSYLTADSTLSTFSTKVCEIDATDVYTGMKTRTTLAKFDKNSCVAAGGTWDSTKSKCSLTLGSSNCGNLTNKTYTATDGSTQNYGTAIWYATYKPAVSYSCGRCHSTGWTSDATVNTAKEPEKSFIGISWNGTIGNVNGKVNLMGGVRNVTIPSPLNDTGYLNGSSSWDKYGIECSRCHAATDGNHASFPGSGTGGDKTALCMNCHRQETAGVPDTYILQQAGKNVSASQMTVGSSHGALGFPGHFHGNQFLNSPHAKFTGTWGQIGCPPVSISPAGTADCTSSMSGTYASKFQQYGAGEGGCTTCHDVHNTVIKNGPDQVSGIKKTCTDCHLNATDTLAPQVTGKTINHPGGPGTPLENFDPKNPTPEACVICHMPHGNHFFRINTDGNYQAIPAIAGTYTTSANTSADGSYVNAVWNDLDAACGQCHGGSAGPTAVAHFAPYLTKAALANVASGMHTVGALHNSPTNVAGPSSTSATINTRPTASNTVTQSGWVVNVTDTVTATPSTDKCQATVTWGDGTSDTSITAPCASSSFSHTYTKAGTYAVLETVTDMANYLTASTTPAEMAVPKKYSVTATVIDLGDGTCVTNTGGITTTYSHTIQANCTTALALGGLGGTWTVNGLPMAAVYLYGANGEQYAGLTGGTGVVTINNVNVDTYGVRVVKGSYTCTITSPAPPSPLAVTAPVTNVAATCSIQ